MPREEDNAVLNDIITRVNTLDSRMRIVAQRMKIIEKNEQIIGKTLITHSKKIKDVELGQTAAIGAPSIDLSELKKIDIEVKQAQSEISSFVNEMKNEVIKNRQLLDKLREEVNEMKYVLDNINPVAYVTIDQVSDLIDEKLRKKSV